MGERFFRGLILKLHNPIQTVDIGGETVRIGKLTLAAAIEIESHLADLPTPLERLEKSGVLPQLPAEVAADLTGTAMQESAFFPPDAIGALCNSKILGRGSFGKAFLSAMIRAYNPHFDDGEIDRIAGKATAETVLAVQGIALGVTTDPKDESGIGAATIPQTGSTGGESSPG